MALEKVSVVKFKSVIGYSQFNGCVCDFKSLRGHTYGQTWLYW